MQRAEVVLNVIQDTGEPRDTEIGHAWFGGGNLEKCSLSNSLGSYPTSRAVLRGGGGGNATSLPDQLCAARFGRIGRGTFTPSAYPAPGFKWSPVRGPDAAAGWLSLASELHHL